jgi:hypothetical protein
LLDECRKQGIDSNQRGSSLWINREEHVQWYHLSLSLDTFELWQVNTKSNTRIDISNKGIAWPSDLDGRYKNVDNWEERQWVDMETNG